MQHSRHEIATVFMRGLGPTQHTSAAHARRLERSWARLRTSDAGTPEAHLVGCDRLCGEARGHYPRTSSNEETASSKVDPEFETCAEFEM